MKTGKATFNPQTGYIEISFQGIPDKRKRSTMKTNGFRWNKYHKIWYLYGAPVLNRNTWKMINNPVKTALQAVSEFTEIDIDKVMQELTAACHDAGERQMEMDCGIC